jgi:uncharacterized CHY-type Zn-finger protein
MSMGLPDETRPWPKTKHEDRVATRGIIEEDAKPKHCHACKQVITGKVYRVGSDLYECFRCHNE